MSYLKVMNYGDGSCVLKMPTDYVTMDEDEMMYVDGGYKFDMSRSTAGKIIDVAAILATAGLGASATVGKIATKIGWNTLKSKSKKAMVKLGVTTAAATTALEIIKTVSDFSIGSALAWVLDKTDRSGLNGRIQY